MYKSRGLVKSLCKAGMEPVPETTSMVEQHSQAFDPLISVIIPCYNVEEYVEQCLDSIVDQQVTGLEIIVIDDASTDGTWERLRKYQELDFVRLLKLEKNVGLGGARNVGIGLSQGDYLLFLDSDDWLVDGALEELSHCAQRSTPDLIFFNYARVYGKAGAFAGPYDDLFKSVDQCVRPEDKNALLLDFPTMAWIKLYRRAFVLQSGIVFGDGFYEDVNWSYSLTILARKIEMLPVVLYCYRQRSGSILTSKDERHLDLIQEYEKLFKLANELEDDRYRKKLASKAIEHYEVTLFVRSRRFSWAGMRRFFLKAHEQMSTLAPEEIAHVISDSSSWAVALKRRVLLRGGSTSFFACFIIFRIAYFATRPFKLFKTYFSTRRVDISTPIQSQISRPS